MREIEQREWKAVLWEEWGVGERRCGGRELEALRVWSGGHCADRRGLCLYLRERASRRRGRVGEAGLDTATLENKLGR